MAKQKDASKELRKLNRGELLTMLISITKRCDELEQELEEANRKLEDRNILISESGTMAEAMLKINGVMEAADKASREYVETIRSMYSNQDEAVLNMVNDTKAQCARIEMETKARCQDMILKAQEESQAYWNNAFAQVQKYKAVIDSMKDMIAKQKQQG